MNLIHKKRFIKIFLMHYRAFSAARITFFLKALGKILDFKNLIIDLWVTKTGLKSLRLLIWYAITSLLHRSLIADKFSFCQMKVRYNYDNLIGQPTRNIYLNSIYIDFISCNFTFSYFFVFKFNMLFEVFSP